MMVTQPHQEGPSGSKFCQLVGASSNKSLIGTQQEYRHQLVHHDATNAATKNMTQDAHLKIVFKTGSSKNQKQLAEGCEYVHMVVNASQLTVYHTAGVCWELGDQFIAAHNGKPRWSTKALVCTVHEIELHNALSAWVLPDEFPDKHPREWTKKALITFEEAMEGYMVEVLAASHCLQQQQISYRDAPCLRTWQCKKVESSRNSPTCAWPCTWLKSPKEGCCGPQKRKHNTR
jgi:hypothetical protein